MIFWSSWAQDQGQRSDSLAVASKIAGRISTSAHS